MSYCKKCGAEIEKGKDYCTYCGTDVNDTSFFTAREEKTDKTTENRHNTEYSTGYNAGYRSNNDVIEFDSQDVKNNKGISAVAYLGFVGLIIALITSSSSKFLRFHANQSLVLSLSVIIGVFVVGVPCLGWLIYVMWILCAFIFGVMGFVSALSGNAQKLPLIGNIQLIKL